MSFSLWNSCPCLFRFLSNSLLLYWVLKHSQNRRLLGTRGNQRRRCIMAMKLKLNYLDSILDKERSNWLKKRTLKCRNVWSHFEDTLVILFQTADGIHGLWCRLIWYCCCFRHQKSAVQIPSATMSIFYQFQLTVPNMHPTYNTAKRPEAYIHRDRSSHIERPCVHSLLDACMQNQV